MRAAGTAGRFARPGARAIYSLGMPLDLPPSSHRSTGLVDVLDRVLDKGLVIAGDIKVSLAEVELLTIRIRLLVCSLDKAQEIGLDWWRHDRDLSPGAHRSAVAENEEVTPITSHAPSNFPRFRVGCGGQVLLLELRQTFGAELHGQENSSRGRQHHHPEGR